MSLRLEITGNAVLAFTVRFKLVWSFFLLFILSSCDQSTAQTRENMAEEITTENSLGTEVKDQPKILASLHPIALIAASVADPQFITTLIPNASDPHSFTLKPSDLRTLQQANIVIWSGAASEPYLHPFQNRWPHQQWIDMSQLDQTKPQRSFEQAPHSWLSYRYARLTIQAVSKALDKDPSDALSRLKTVSLTSERKLEPVKNKGFFVSHPAYDHWIEHHQLLQLGNLMGEQKQGVSIKEVGRLRQLAGNGAVNCIFTEPGINTFFANSLIQLAKRQNIEIKQYQLDPLGRHISVTPDGYTNFINDLTDRTVQCLGSD